MWMNILKAKTTSFMVKDEVWNQAGGEGMNSILDLERKLDRELQLSEEGISEGIPEKGKLVRE
jgi:hypothetical protein